MGLELPSQLSISGDALRLSYSLVLALTPIESAADLSCSVLLLLEYFTFGSLPRGRRIPRSLDIEQDQHVCVNNLSTLTAG